MKTTKGYIRSILGSFWDNEKMETTKGYVGIILGVILG